MRILLAILAALSFATPALADEPSCNQGDRKFGPNCIHEEVLPATASSDYDSPLTLSTVYRPGKTPTIVWGENPGKVTESDAKHIRVVQDLKTKDGKTLHIDVTYRWNGSKYVD